MTTTPTGSPPPMPVSGGHDKFRGATRTPPEVGNRAAGSNASAGGLTTVGTAGDGDHPRTGRTRRCLCVQCPLPGPARSVQQRFLKAVLNADPACRWLRPFAFGEQGGVRFGITGRADRFLDDWRNWPKSTDCAAKIRETAANPRPQDQDAHFWSLN